MTEQVMVFLKGAAMGAANVIPGVSGGTVAFITGIYERLITALKSFGVSAVKELLSGKFAAFAKRVDLMFLIWLGLGVVTSFLVLAKLLDYLFENQKVFVWAFFFGLILASIFFVGREVRKWSASRILMVLIGTGVAVAIALLKPASENDSTMYLVLCGVAAMASMIIPGLSGSFVLLLMGNYFLVLRAVNERDIGTLFPVAIGAVVGLLALSHLLAWVFRTHHDVAVSLLTGFVAGSLLLIWPWKNEVVQAVEIGDEVKEKVVGYEWLAPDMSAQTLGAIGLMVAGFLAVWLMEKGGGSRGKEGKADGAAAESGA
jgi:putative membrane protein